MITFLLILIVCILLFGRDAILSVLGWLLLLAIVLAVGGLITWGVFGLYESARTATLDDWMVLSFLVGFFGLLALTVLWNSPIHQKWKRRK